MILQALQGYYRRLLDENRMVAQGFQEKEIPFVIMLDADGKCVDLEDTRSGEGRNRRARRFVVPREVKRSGKNAWQTANLLWDNEGYVLGASAEQPAKANKQHQTFREAVEKAFPERIDTGVDAVLRFLQAGEFSAVFLHPCWIEVASKVANLAFRLKGDTALVCERPVVRERIAALATADTDTAAHQACLITGEKDVPARLHALLKGVRGTNTRGGHIVSFNLPAFRSHGKDQGANAPVGRRAEFAYTTALNTLLNRDSRQKLLVGDATAVFWAERNHNS